MMQIVFFAHNQTAYDDALQVVREGNYSMIEVCFVHMHQVIAEAKAAVARGAQIVIARGSQAFMIKENVAVTVVDVMLTGQDIALLIKSCCRLVKKTRPNIAIVGIRNMFDDLSYFDTIFDVVLNSYLSTTTDELLPMVDRALANGADIVIGGNIVNEYCAQMGIPSIFLSSTQMPIKAAIGIALQVLESSELQKKDVAQLRALLDHSFNGILRVDIQGKIVLANYNASKMLLDKPMEMVGMDIYSFFQPIDAEHIDLALKKGQEAYFIHTTINQKELYFNVAAIHVNNQLDGAILSLSEVQTLNKINIDLHNSSKSNQAGALSELKLESPVMKRLLKRLPQYATSDAPILIYGEPGTEKDLLAYELHLQSERRCESFFSLRFGSVPEEKQHELLRQTHLEEIGYGTFYIKDLEQMSHQNQTALVELISDKKDPFTGKRLNLRIIVATAIEPKELLLTGTVNPELYWLLCPQQLYLPSLCSRREDIRPIITVAIKEACDKCCKYVVLTAEARELLCRYEWAGNYRQLTAYCQGLVVAAQSRSIGVELVSQRLQELYAGTSHDSAAGVSGPQPSDPRSRQLYLAMKRHNGNRQAMAAELGISSTTLWRQLKKYDFI